jgi:hypothetical protein
MTTVSECMVSKSSLNWLSAKNYITQETMWIFVFFRQTNLATIKSYTLIIIILIYKPAMLHVLYTLQCLLNCIQQLDFVVCL